MKKAVGEPPLEVKVCCEEIDKFKIQVMTRH